MAYLFQKAKSTINEHIKNVYSEKELDDQVTMNKFGNSEFPVIWRKRPGVGRSHFMKDYPSNSLAFYGTVARWSGL
jgi:hypothetical protein